MISRMCRLVGPLPRLQNEPLGESFEALSTSYVLFKYDFRTSSLDAFSQVYTVVLAITCCVSKGQPTKPVGGQLEVRSVRMKALKKSGLRVSSLSGSSVSICPQEWHHPASKIQISNSKNLGLCAGF